MRYATRLSGLILLLVLSVAVPRATSAADAKRHNDLFFQTFMTRCMPSAHSGRGYVTDGLSKLDQRLGQFWLKGAPGSVWAPDPALRVLLIIRDGDAGCSVVSLFGDAAALEKLIEYWFDPKQSPFTRDFFERTADGGFTSHYRADCPGGTWCRTIFNVRAAPAPGQLAIMGTAARVRP